VNILRRLGVHRREHVLVARDFSLFTSVNIVSLVLLNGTTFWLLRVLGPDLAGIWTALDLLPGYATYAHLGVMNAAERDLPYLLGAGRTRDFDALKNTLHWLAHALGALLASIVIAGAFAYRERLRPETFVGLLIYAPCIWAQIVATYYLVLYRARKRFIALSGRQGLANLLKAVALVSAGAAFGLYGVLGAELASTVLLAALLYGGLDEMFARTFERARIRPLVAEGVPMLAGAVAFETLRPGGTTGADQMVILAALGATPLAVYRITSIVCQGVYYPLNALSTVMYPRFQERYGQTQTIASLRRFVELQLQVLADVLLAGIALLYIALPPAIAAFLPKYVDTIAPLRIMLVATYFVALAGPAGQLLLTIHKQLSALLVAVPATALAFAGGILGSRYGLPGIAVGVAIACAVEFVALNAYALSYVVERDRIAIDLVTIAATAAVVIGAAMAIEQVVPAGPPAISAVGGLRLAAVAAMCAPLVLRAMRRIRALQAAEPVDNLRAGH
jgi:O-antigen/teichoic acid export membrane protein